MTPTMLQLYGQDGVDNLGEAFQLMDQVLERMQKTTYEIDRKTEGTEVRLREVASEMELHNQRLEVVERRLLSVESDLGLVEAKSECVLPPGAVQEGKVPDWVTAGLLKQQLRDKARRGGGVAGRCGAIPLSRRRLDTPGWTPQRGPTSKVPPKAAHARGCVSEAECRRAMDAGGVAVGGGAGAAGRGAAAKGALARGRPSVSSLAAAAATASAAPSATAGAAASQPDVRSPTRRVSASPSVPAVATTAESDAASAAGATEQPAPRAGAGGKRLRAVKRQRRAPSHARPPRRLPPPPPFAHKKRAQSSAPKAAAPGSPPPGAHGHAHAHAHKGAQPQGSATTTASQRERLGKRLLKVAQEGSVGAVRHLLRQGADANFRAAWRWTALHWACMKAHPDVVALLLQNGADTGSKTTSGNTPLHMAAHDDHSGQCATLLTKAGAEVDVWNDFGRTPLHLSAESGNTAAVRALLSAGASRIAEDTSGRLPYELAKDEALRQLLSPRRHPLGRTASHVRTV